MKTVDTTNYGPWIEWGGGATPVAYGTPIIVRHRSGDVYEGPAGTTYSERWDNFGYQADIVAYAVRKDVAEHTAAKETKSALDVQVAGGHYKGKRIQPVEYIEANKLTFLEGCVVKRITRWRDKQGTSRFEDLEKIKHEIDLMIEMETKYGDA